MVHRTSLAVLAVGLLVASSFVGAAAFTSANVQRDVTVGIDADDTAIIGLSSGTADAARLNSNGALVLDPERSDSTFNGLNQDATFTYGDDTDAGTASSSNAFQVTNNDDVSHDFTFNYTQSAGNATLTYAVAYDSNDDGTVNSTDTLATFGGSSTTITLDSGETAYVVVTFDTGTGTTTVDGTLEIKAT